MESFDRHMKKLLKIALITILTLIIAVTVAFFGLIFFIIRLNPLFLALVAEFKVVNESGQYIRVTPVGMVEGNGSYCPLGVYYQKLPSEKKLRNVYDVEMKAGETINIIYDMDDINFRHILIKTAFGDIFIMDTDKCGSLHASCGPQNSKYVIPDLSTLSKASPELLPLLTGQCVHYSGAKEYNLDDFAIATCHLPYHDPVLEKCSANPD